MSNLKRTLGFAGPLVPLFVLASIGAASAVPAGAVAGVGGGAGGALPWETVLASLATALTGNTAKIICVIAIFVAGIALIFGEDMGHFARRLLMIVIAAAFLLGAAGFVTTFLGGAHV